MTLLLTAIFIILSIWLYNKTYKVCWTSHKYLLLTLACVKGGLTMKTTNGADACTSVVDIHIINIKDEFIYVIMQVHNVQNPSIIIIRRNYIYTCTHTYVHISTCSTNLVNFVPIKLITLFQLSYKNIILLCTRYNMIPASAGQYIRISIISRYEDIQ